MKVNKRILLIGVLLGLITVFFLNRYINSLNQTEEAVAATSYSEVVVAAKSIPAHVKITEDMVVISSIPTDAVHPDTVLTLDKVVGGISRAEIINGEQILSGRIVLDDKAGTLSYWIPENMRAITISVSQVSGVANYIAVGDKVDILVTYDTNMKEAFVGEVEDEESKPTTFTQFQNIEVIALGGFKAPTETISYEQPGTITILVNPEQAEVVAFSLLNGSYHLTLRNPIDSNINELDHYGKDNFESFKVR